MSVMDMLQTEMAQRVRLAAACDTAPDLLDQLADDPDVTVRASLALNPVLPPRAEMRLVGDADARVRTLLGTRLAALCPEVAVPERAQLRGRLLGALTRLVQDEAARVRLAIAEVLKDMPEAPRELVLRLARDTELDVAGPVIQLSPVLTDEDLLSLIATRPGSARMVAARAGLPAAVCDAVVDAADDEAIRTLLENRSAAICEATLDRLVAQAAEHESWQAPLVDRPLLSAPAMQSLANLVSATLLEQLAARPDMPPLLAEELRGRLATQRAAQEDAPPWPREDPDLPAALRLARRLRQELRLDEGAFTAALRGNQPRLVLALLSVAAEQPPELVHRAAMMRSPKALVSLVWKAGLPAPFAAPVQSLLGQVSPDAVLAPKAGGFPLSNDEMSWQLQFLRETR